MFCRSCSVSDGSSNSGFYEFLPSGGAYNNSINTIFDGQGDNIYSDGTLQILSSNNVPKFQVNFKDLFPYSLSTLTFDATDTDIEYFTAEVSFKYTNYIITNIRGQDL